MRSNHFLHTWRRNGLTLVEVVAGLALMGTLLVGVLMASNRHARQVREADRRLAAVRAADQLLVLWYGSQTGVPFPATGEVSDPQSQRFRWMTTPLGSILSDEGSESRELGLTIVRLELRAADAPEDGRALASVEVVIDSSQKPNGSGGANAPR